MQANGAFRSGANASAKGRSPYSLFFTAAHLPQFKLADHGSDRARVTEVKVDTRPRQLGLPFTRLAFPSNRSALCSLRL